MADVFGHYAEDLAGSAAWDEVFEAAERPRSHYAALCDTLRLFSGADMAERKAGLDRAFQHAGITFDHDGAEHGWSLDLVPRLLTASEWDLIERGVRQRVKALEGFLADVYGPQEILRDAIVPRHAVLASRGYHRVAGQFAACEGVRIHVAGVDLVRDEAGRFRVLEDNIRVPSGVSYVLENRHAMTKVLPEAFATHRVRPVADYAVQLLDALRATAPAGVDYPTVVLLTPGRYNSAYFEHTLLARQMGVELVAGRDLVVRDDRVYMHTTAGEKVVDVVYRRIDDEWLDPGQFRADSVVGCAGLVGAARAGRVTIANAVGNGVADDMLMYTYVPDFIRYYLGEQPVLNNVETYRLEDSDQRSHVLDQLDSLVVKPVDGSGGTGIVIGPQATDASLAGLRRQIEANPGGWVAQPVVHPSTSPTLIGGRLSARHVDLRLFAINDGQDVRVLPGGLTRVALAEGGLIVNSSRGGGSKDTWVLAPELPPDPQTLLWSDRKRPGRATAAGGHDILSRTAEVLFWMGRYSERAEHTARILDVHVQRVMDDPWLDEEQASRALLAVMGVPPPSLEINSAGVTALLGYDNASRSSVAGAIGAARENARGARDVISSEVWECLNATWLELPDRIGMADHLGPHVFFRYVRQRTAMLTGLMGATLSQDDGRRFVELGWNLERIDMTARLLSSCLADPAVTSSWVSVLRSCGAHEAFLRTYRRAADGPTVAEFLLLDRLFPRSAYSALSMVERLLAELDTTSKTTSEPHVHVRDEARRIAGRTRASLEFQMVDELMNHLPGLLSLLQDSCSGIDAHIAQRYFPHHALPR